MNEICSFFADMLPHIRSNQLFQFQMKYKIHLRYVIAFFNESDKLNLSYNLFASMLNF
jgi:hypothetical protein